MKKTTFIYLTLTILFVNTQAQLNKATSFGGRELTSSGIPTFSLLVPQNTTSSRWADTEIAEYQTWEAQSIAISHYVSEKAPNKEKKVEANKTLLYFEDIDTKKLEIIKYNYEYGLYLNQFYINIEVKENRKLYQYWYQKNFFKEGPGNSTRIYFNTEADAKAGLVKLKDAMLDAALDLDAVIERPKLEEYFSYQEEYPDGISSSALKDKRDSEPDVINTNTEVKSNSTSNSNNQNNNAPKAIVKTEATIELRNRSKASANIIITSPNGGSKNNFSINASGSKKERIKVGSTISVNGSVVLTVTADMDGESKIIAQ